MSAATKWLIARIVLASSIVASVPLEAAKLTISGISPTQVGSTSVCTINSLTESGDGDWLLTCGSGTNTITISPVANGTVCDNYTSLSANGNGDWTISGCTFASPTVTLDAPSAPGTFTAGTPYLLKATASAPTGRTISSVEFLAGGSLINAGTFSGSQYQWSWNPPAGIYPVSVRATDSAGATYETSTVQMTFGGGGGGGGGSATNVVEYSRDAAGNIIGITRRRTDSLAVTGFSPASGLVGTAVTIYGNAFSATPSSNAVSFNGVSATVSASTSTSISTTVPTGATTGPIDVTVGASTATSPFSFIVTAGGAPTIASFTPVRGAAGTTVSVTGTNFNTSPGATAVTLNGVTASATVSSSTALSFVVPGSAGSGRIVVSTAGGTATSLTDFIVPPVGVNAADILVAQRATVDAPGLHLALGTANKHAMLLFNGTAGAYLTVHFAPFSGTPTTGAVSYKVIGPDNSVLQTGTVGNLTKPTIHLPRLTASGTHAILLSPGIATISAIARVITDTTLVIDGGSGTTAIDAAFQSARFPFNAITGQAIGVGVTVGPFSVGTTPPLPAFQILKPDGSVLVNVSSGCAGIAPGYNPQGNCDGEAVIPMSGTYAVYLAMPVNGYANATVQVTGDASGTLTGDTAQDVSLTRVGQDMRYTFTAGVGDSYSVDISGASISPQVQALASRVLLPNGTAFVVCPNVTPPNGLDCNLPNIATAGTYTVAVDPNYGAYGTFKLILKNGALVATSDAPTAFTTANNAETVRFRFAATTGQNLTFAITSLAHVPAGGTTYLGVYRPDGSKITSASCVPAIGGATCKLSLVNLPPGNYGVILLPPPGAKISGNFLISADVTDTLVDGTPLTVTVARPGQDARLQFAGTAGDSTSIRLYGATTAPSGQPINVSVFSPSGTAVGSLQQFTGSGLVNLPNLPATGNYSVVLTPVYGATWQGDVLLEAGPLVTIDGAALSLSAPSAGWPLRFRVSGTAGQRLELGLSGLTYASSSASTTGLAFFRGDGSGMATTSCSTSASCEAFHASLPTTGNYYGVFTPPAASTITGGSLEISTPATGTFVVDDPAQTVTVTRAGQTARFTFAGTSGQLLRLNWSSSTVAGSATVAVTVLKPDGGTLSSSSFVNAATGGFDVASLPATGSYTVVFDPTLAATFSASTELVTR